jgi:hypothetical protein
MLRARLLAAVGSVLAGWATLFALTYIIERPLLIWTARLVGAHWVATAKLSLDCLALAAAGWVIGRLDRSLLGAFAFAGTLGFCNLDPLLDIDVPRLIGLTVDAVRDPRIWTALPTIAVQYLFLFGSLVVGALLSRPASRPLSLFGGNLR